MANSNIQTIPEPIVGLQFIRVTGGQRTDGSVFRVEIPSEITKVDAHMINFKSTIPEAIDPVTKCNWACGGGIVRKFWADSFEKGRVKFINN